MGAEVRDHCEKLLHRAESRGRCAVAITAQEASRFRYLVRKGILTSPYPGLFVSVERWGKLKPDQRQRHLMRTLCDLHPAWVFCGVSAAIAHGLDVGYPVIQRLELATVAGRAAHSSGLTVRRLTDTRKPKRIDGMRVTSLEVTVRDCLRILPFKHGLAIADSAIRDKHRSKEWLNSLFAKAMPGMRGVRHARFVATHVDPRAANGGESQARATFMMLGFAAPDLQHEIIDPLDGSKMYSDFSWETHAGQLVLGELDGREKYLNKRMNHGSTLTAMTRERQRESRLTMAGAKVMRFSFSQLGDLGYMTNLLLQYGVPVAGTPSRMDMRPFGWGITPHADQMVEDDFFESLSPIPRVMPDLSNRSGSYAYRSIFASFNDELAWIRTLRRRIERECGALLAPTPPCQRVLSCP